VAGAIDVRVVALVALVLNVCGRNCNAALFFFRRCVDRIVGASLGEALLCSTVVIAAVSVVLPWSTWPIVPTFTCGLFRSNLSLAISILLVVV
jgi:hypothetical protein